MRSFFLVAACLFLCCCDYRPASKTVGSDAPGLPHFCIGEAYLTHERENIVVYNEVPEEQTARVLIGKSQDFRLDQRKIDPSFAYFFVQAGALCDFDPTKYPGADVGLILVKDKVDVRTTMSEEGLLAIIKASYAK